LFGVKQGDTQMTVLGLFIASLFYFSSVAAPLEHLSPQKPNKKLFCSSVIVSVLGQSAVHIATLLLVVEMSQSYAEIDDGFAVPDGEFRPNLLNSLVFILSAWVQLNTFAVNYCGYPFTTPLQENKNLWYVLLAGWASIIVIISMDMIPLFGDYINFYLELVSFPTDLFPTTNDDIKVEEFSDVTNNNMIVYSSNILKQFLNIFYEISFSFRMTLICLLMINLVSVFIIERFARLLY
jgi:cation-transporting ATPase 13A1